MTAEKFEKIRESVDVLSSLSEEEWGELERFFLEKLGLADENDFNQKSTKEDIDSKIKAFLKKQGIPANLLGYKYLGESIKYMLESTDMYSVGMTKELYPQVAKRMNVTPSKVERAIRHAIEVAWDRGDCDEHDEMFGFAININRGKPTNSEAIMTFTEYLKNN